MVWLKEKMNDILYWIKYPFVWIKAEIAFRRKMKKLREEDPYIYD